MEKNNEVNCRYQYCILKCVSDTYHKGMYVDDWDVSGFSHVTEREYARPYVLLHISKTLRMMRKKSKEVYEPIPIDLKDSKFKKWNWSRWCKVYSIIRRNFERYNNEKNKIKNTQLYIKND